MFEPKPMASLSSGLLARKGDAVPAMRRTYVPMTSVAPLPVSVQDDVARDEPHDALGWNDLGVDIDPSTPIVTQQQRRIARNFAHVRKARVSNDQRPRKAKAAFTLRLDAERHLRLRLASAVGNRSAQQIVTEALDTLLAGRPELDALVAQARKAKP